jgi:hypothetical protein
MATRIQAKSRPAKKFLASATYSTGTGVVSAVSGRMPKLDDRGYPANGGVPNPVLVKITVVA